MTKKKISRAGIIPYYISDPGETIYMLFMRPSDPKFGSFFFFFQTIKGKIDGDETPLEAAIREGTEEAGLFPPNLDGTPHHLGRFLGRTDIFVARIKDPDMFGDPTTPEEVESTRWMTPEEFYAEGRDLHKPVIKAAVRWIKEQQKKQQKALDEIYLVMRDIEKGFSWDDVKEETGTKRTLSVQPYEVWEYETTTSTQKMFALRDPNEDLKSTAALVIGTPTNDGYFLIQRAWTNPDKRRQGLMSQLYITLNTQLQMSLASDMQQSSAMMKVWKHLPLPQYVYDMETQKKIKRDEISDDEIYSNENPSRYRLLIEKSNRYVFEQQVLENFDPADTITYEKSTVTHPYNKGRYI